MYLYCTNNKMSALLVVVLMYPQYILSILFPVFPLTCSICLVSMGAFTYWGYDSGSPIFRLSRYMDDALGMGWIYPIPCPQTDQTTIFACHPHGIIPSSALSFMSQNIPVVVARNMLTSIMAPFGLKFIGAVDNSRETVIRTIQNHQSLAIYPGGADEMCQSDRDCTYRFVRIRDGIIRLAIQHNCTIVPTWIPAECTVLTPLLCGYNRWKTWIWETFRIPLAPNVGRYCVPGFPRCGPVHIYYGTPIKCRLGIDTIEHIRGQYQEELVRLAKMSGHCIRTAVW